MGRAFEFRKERKFKRWAGMAKTFTRIGREIALAVKASGPNPEYNSRLRLAIQNAKSANMPKVNVESAIKKATGKEAENFQEVLYEGKGPHGVAILVETATDNPTRTVANVRSHFSKFGGNMGATGGVLFQFKRMGVFRLRPEGIDPESLELELIDHGLEEMGESTGEKGEPQLVIRCGFGEFGHLQKALEDRKLVPISAESEYIATTPVELPEGQANSVLKLVDLMEQDDDVQRVFHNLL